MRTGLSVLGVLVSVALFVVAGGAVASGGESGGGHGGSSGGGSRNGAATAATTTPCGGLTLAIVPTVTDHGAVHGSWTATGRTSRGCDGTDRYAIRFVDRSADTTCPASIPDVLGSTYRPKYGVKPLSRYRRMFGVPTTCEGHRQSVSATLVDLRSGATLGTASTTFTP